MKNKKFIILMMGMFLLTTSMEVSAKTLRATEIEASEWKNLSQGKLQDVIIEFRQGDELPVSFETQGDLIETNQPRS